MTNEQLAAVIPTAAALPLPAAATRAGIAEYIAPPEPASEAQPVNCEAVALMSALLKTAPPRVPLWQSRKDERAIEADDWAETQPPCAARPVDKVLSVIAAEPSADTIPPWTETDGYTDRDQRTGGKHVTRVSHSRGGAVSMR